MNDVSRVVLERLEWSGSARELRCPFCYRPKVEGHTEDCMMKLALVKPAMTIEAKFRELVDKLATGVISCVACSDCKQTAEELLKFLASPLAEVGGYVTPKEFRHMTVREQAEFYAEKNWVVRKWKDSASGTPSKESLASWRLVNALEEEVVRLNDEIRSWMSEVRLWRGAWLRHLGGFIIRKHHEIDGFGLRHEQQLRDEYERGVGDAKNAMACRDRWIEEVGKALCVPPNSVMD